MLTKFLKMSSEGEIKKVKLDQETLPNGSEETTSNLNQRLLKIIDWKLNSIVSNIVEALETQKQQSESKLKKQPKPESKPKTEKKVTKAKKKKVAEEEEEF
jgi:hypothetical protein